MVILGSLNEEVKEISLQDLTFATKKKEKEKLFRRRRELFKT